MRRNTARQALVHGLGVLLGLGALLWMFPMAMRTGWADITQTLLTLSVLPLAALTLLWAAGKFAHSVALAAAMPGLDCRRALMLSLTGSAVANVLPLGGAAGIALNYRMSRGWGFTAPAIATYTVVVNLCDVMMKLFLPLALIPLAVAGALPGPLTDRVSAELIICAAAGLGLVGAFTTGFLAAGGPLRRLSVRLDGWRVLERVVVVIEQVASTIAGAWSRLGVGMFAYTVLLLTLLAACLWVSGAALPFTLILAAFCIERLLTLIPITPAGIGVVEIGLAGILMLGPAVAGPDVASGILLYRLLTVGLGIPLGGVLLLAWLRSFRS